MGAPDNVFELGRSRQAARGVMDFALADQLRDQIAELGWEILDIPGGFEFRAKSRFPIFAYMTDMRHSFTDTKFPVICALIVDGFIADAAISVQRIKAISDAAVVILVSGTHDLSTLLELLDNRTFIIQVSQGVGWGEAANALLKYSPAPYIVIMDPSTHLTADAITPVLEKLNTGDWSAVGWKGGLINLEDEWRTVDDHGNGEVDVLFSYFLALNVEHALGAGGFNARAVYYRNADIEFSLRLRQTQGRLLQMDLPLTQERHHGYYDVNPEFREAQSKKTYDRILERFRGKDEILVTRR